MRNTRTISIEKAVTLNLGGMEQPVVTSYQLGLILWRLYRSGLFQGQKIKINKRVPDSQEYKSIINQLHETGLIRERKDFARETVFDIFGKELSSSEDIACSVDPFAYISHLSAMVYHGLTDRIPQVLFLSTPARQQWHEFARERMERDLGDDLADYESCGMPLLLRTEFSKIGRRPVKRYASLHFGAFKLVKSKPLRVSTIGRTFLDMLRKPDYCGGIHHVMEVFKECGERYLELIADEIDLHGNKIDKVRAGYILEEHCGFSSDRFEPWLEAVQRGGSQKLDPSAEYRETYSERWCLSINID